MRIRKLFAVAPIKGAGATFPYPIYASNALGCAALPKAVVDLEMQAQKTEL